MQERIKSILPLLQRLREPVVRGFNLSDDSAVCITQIAERGREFLLGARHLRTGSLQASGRSGQAGFKEILA